MGNKKLKGAHSLLVSLLSNSLARNYKNLHENRKFVSEFTNVQYRSPSQLNLSSSQPTKHARVTFSHLRPVIQARFSSRFSYQKMIQ